MFVIIVFKVIRELVSWGVFWIRIKKGDRFVVVNGEYVIIIERDDRYGYILSCDFGGIKKWCICFMVDVIGYIMFYVVVNEVLYYKVDI